jgi:hypothetical protein
LAGANPVVNGQLTIPSVVIMTVAFIAAPTDTNPIAGALSVDKAEASLAYIVEPE